MSIDSQPSPSTSPVTLVSIGFLLGAVVVGACWLLSRSGNAMRNDMVRDVTVDYNYEAAPRSATNIEGHELDSVEFFPSYVVMTDKRGKKQLIALSRLRKFDYRPTKP